MRVYHADPNGSGHINNMITVKYFASLKEQLGKDEDHFDAETLRTVGDVWRKAAGDKPLRGVLCAVNQEYAAAGHPISDGDEVAFFPPVTGG